MLRLIFIAVVLIVLLTLLSYVPGMVGLVAARILGAGLGLICPLSLALLFFAPGLFRQTNDELQFFFERIRSRRHEIAELERKIAQLDKPHHMIQLGTVYLSQGRHAKATKLFENAVEREPDSVDGQYKLALCRYNDNRFEESARLLESVQEAKPNYDYGMAWLRLAQSQHRVGNLQRAAEIYEMLLRYYPGHAEGSFWYAELVAAGDEFSRARELMENLIFTVRHSPGFQKRRNRHWMFKARWWLYRNAHQQDAPAASSDAAASPAAEQVAQSQDEDDA